MRPDFIVHFPPSFERIARAAQRHEQIHVQAFVPQFTVKGFYVAVVRGLARPDEFELYPVPEGPCVHRLAVELRAVIDLDAERGAALLTDALKVGYDLFARQGKARNNSQRFARV